MPSGLLELFAEALPQLVAEESIRRATEIGVGSGVYTRDQARRIWQDWQDWAVPIKPAPVILTHDQRVIMARSMGIGVTVVPKRSG